MVKSNVKIWVFLWLQQLYFFSVHTAASSDEDQS